MTTATPLSKVDLNTKFLGLAGSELVQMPFSAFPEATTETKGFMSADDKKKINSRLSTLSSTVFDANLIKEDAVITANRWANTPESVIGCLEVIVYSADWILQRFTKISSTPVVWERSFYGGTTWGEWKFFECPKSVLPIIFKGNADGKSMISDESGYVNFGRMYSSGFPYISYGVRYNDSNTPISSSVLSAISRFVYYFGADGIYFGSAPGQNTPIGEELQGFTGFKKIVSI